MVLRIIVALLWGTIGAIAGAIDGAAFGWAFGWPLSQGAQLGAVLAGGVGFLAGLLRQPGKKMHLVAGQSETKYNLELCAWCKGTGKEGRKSLRLCSVCHGQGSLLAEHPSRKCPKCKGKGRASLGGRCKVCGGAGWSTYAHLQGATIHRQSRGETKVAL